MQNNSGHTDSRFTKTLESNINSDSIVQAGLGHLIVKDTIRENIMAILDSDLVYQGFYYDEIPENQMIGKVPAGAAFMNNSFLPQNAETINANYEARLKKPNDELKIVDYCLGLFQTNPSELEIQSLRREIIGKLEELTMKIIEGKREKGEELRDIFSNKLFLDRVLNCFSKNNNSSVLADLNELYDIKQNEIDLINSELESTKKLQNFRKVNFGTYN